jgi:hypothetical protein
MRGIEVEALSQGGRRKSRGRGRGSITGRATHQSMTDAVQGTLAWVKAAGHVRGMVCAAGRFFCIISAVGHWRSS